ncbi:hypothetical protein LB521_04270 [Mesorhizobium sp. BR-1-1-8]|uniref:hypothetical protein n=1 Tax=Mesorhizobium sp. BR-1-1-8 TaxID=2876659 RepID=UPI001CCB92EB|nr:hypothetical protein [Mesorhizobium sp. BR-1-1-8]MBZ9980361.1 hypothetical protein [Mesorhizobium sp. BR-1-1-8]
MAAAIAPAGENWQFEIGTWITHKDRAMPSLVLSRVRTAKGVEIYGVRSFAEVDPNRDRMMLGEVLRPIDDAAKTISLAHQAGIA